MLLFRSGHECCCCAVVFRPRTRASFSINHLGNGLRRWCFCPPFVGLPPRSLTGGPAPQGPPSA